MLGRLLRTGKLPALLTALGCGVLLYGFLLSPDFEVQRIVVHGVVLGDAQAVASSAQALGSSVFSIDAQAIAARIANLPTVERATVRAELPDRVVIDVVERTPALVWQVDSRLLLVDARGHVLLESDASALPRLVVAGVAPEVGGHVPAEQVSAVLAIIGMLGPQTRELRWSDTEGFSVTLTNGRIIKFGDERRVPLKLAALSAILQRADVWTQLDVSEPDRPYYK